MKRSFCRTGMSSVGWFAGLLLFGVLLQSPSEVAAQPGGFGDWGGRGGGGGDSGWGGRGRGRGGEDRDGGGGRRGGFDPRDFLSRLDRNQNGVLDPDEQEGPASFMIRRLEGSDPSIVSGKPIPLDKITQAFEKTRGGQGGGDRGDRNDRPSPEAEPDLTVEPLVPGFGVPAEAIFLPGFGPTAERFTIATTPDDLKIAREAIRQHDRNGDGQIDEREARRGRFWGQPLDFDRNRDGKVSESELAIRQATRRLASAEASTASKTANQGNAGQQTDEKSLVDFQGRHSYRMNAALEEKGLPKFFGERDVNADRQVSMAEYASDWDEARIEEYYRWDTNRDGVITLTEVRSGVDAGAVASETSSGSRPTLTAVPRSAAMTSMAAAPAAAVSNDPPSAKMLAAAKNIINRYDKNGDLSLSASEWEPMLLSPAAADVDGDGRVTVQEYATYMQSRSRR